jgi:hypothetical protein
MDERAPSRDASYYHDVRTGTGSEGRRSKSNGPESNAVESAQAFAKLITAERLPVHVERLLSRATQIAAGQWECEEKRTAAFCRIRPIRRARRTSSCGSRWSLLDSWRRSAGAKARELKTRECTRERERGAQRGARVSRAPAIVGWVLTHDPTARACPANAPGASVQSRCGRRARDCGQGPPRHGLGVLSGPATALSQPGQREGKAKKKVVKRCLVAGRQK